MRKLAIALAGLASFSTSRPAWAEELLISPPLDDFVVVHEARDDKHSIQKQVTKGETLTDWSVMVITERFDIGNHSPDTFTDYFLHTLHQACPNAGLLREPDDVMVVGASGKVFGTLCKKHPVSGEREVTAGLFVWGQEAFFVKQVIIRPAFEGEADTWMDFLRGTMVCADECVRYAAELLDH